MKAFEIVLIVVASLFVLGVIITAIINKKKGKTSCGCDCSRCSGCCNHKVKTKKEND